MRESHHNHEHFSHYNEGPVGRRHEHYGQGYGYYPEPEPFYGPAYAQAYAQPYAPQYDRTYPPGYYPQQRHGGMSIDEDVVRSVESHNLGRAFNDLHQLEFRESRQQLEHHLRHINNEMHERGLLPGLSIVEARNASGFALEPDRYAQQQSYYQPHQAYYESSRYRGYGYQATPNHVTESRMSPYQMQQYQYQQFGRPSDSPENWTYRYNPSNRTYDGSAKTDAATLAQSTRIVAEVAQEMGVDPRLAVAIMLVESGGNPYARGDGNTSFGLFQLHEHGELGNMSPQEAFNPVTNARTALSVLRSVQHRYGDPGQAAAAAQRPRDRAAYARMVDAALPEAQRLLSMA